MFIKVDHKKCYKFSGSDLYLHKMPVYTANMEDFNKIRNLPRLPLSLGRPQNMEIF